MPKKPHGFLGIPVRHVPGTLDQRNASRLFIPHHGLPPVRESSSSEVSAWCGFVSGSNLPRFCAWTASDALTIAPPWIGCNIRYINNPLRSGDPLPGRKLGTGPYHLLDRLLRIVWPNIDAARSIDQQNSLEPLA